MWHDKCHELVWEAALFLFFSQSQPHHCLPSHLHSLSFFPVSFQDSYTPFPWKIITKIKFLCHWISFNHSIQVSHFMPIPMDPKDFFSTDFLEGMFSYILHQSLSLLIWSCFWHFGFLFFFGKLVLFGLKTLCLCWPGSISSHIGRQHNACPSVIVIGGGISGIAAARVLHDASFKVSDLQLLVLYISEDV